MPTPPRRLLGVDDPDNVLGPIIGLYRDYLGRSRYQAKLSRQYIVSVLHFGDWLRCEGSKLSDVNESLMRRFLTEHLATCSCDYAAPRKAILNRAAINILLRILRVHGVLIPPIQDSIEVELTLFDIKMKEVWGLAWGTRYHRCGIIRRLLRENFLDEIVDLARLTPATIHAFVMGDAEWSFSTIRVMGGAVRCYLRYRALLGNDVSQLLKAVPRPAFSRDAELPEVLSGADVDLLLSAFDDDCRARRRGYAIVRCLTDLGLRSSEVIRLTVDDIDWDRGVLRVSAGKARRSDILPLPPATGEAIVDYILYERPETSRREIFVRHIAPLGEPVGRRVVQKTLLAAYARLGWDRSRVHILRHTFASRLVNTGVPMKQIADVLRHRSVITSARYARVDFERLSAVALPWPGESA